MAAHTGDGAEVLQSPWWWHVTCAHTHRSAAAAGKQAAGGADGKGMDAPACRQSANVGPPAERRQSASAAPLRRRCKQDLSGCACLASGTAHWVCSVTYRRCFATNAPHCGPYCSLVPKVANHQGSNPITAKGSPLRPLVLQDVQVFSVQSRQLTEEQYAQPHGWVVIH